MRHKNCDGFGLPGAKSFPTVYDMNDFTAIISSRYYTLILKVYSWVLE